MNTIIPHLIAHDIIIKCIGSLSNSILSSYNLYNIITTYSNSDFQSYQDEISSTDLANKLLLASSIIKDIIKRHHFVSDKDKELPIEKIIELYKDEIKIEHNEHEDFNIITHIQKNTIISNVPEPVKISLNSTLEIIDKINEILTEIHIKIKTYSNSYIKYVSKLNLSSQINQLISYDNLFDKRLGLLLEVLKIYPDVTK